MNTKILRFHYEEIVYVLMILATNLKGYSDEDLKCFAEAIHRLDTLSKPSFLKDLKVINHKIDDNIISNITDLQSITSRLYSDQWYKALSNDSSLLSLSNFLSRQLIEKLGEEYIEPIMYAEKNMNINW